MNRTEIFSLLEEKYTEYDQSFFIEFDPISIPHQFSEKLDIEISGFITATIAWGQRKTILRNANSLFQQMDQRPYDFVLHATAKEINRLNFNHRTFNVEDLKFFIHSLRKIYKKHSSLEELFIGESLKDRIENFRKEFLQPEHPKRVEKHIASPYSGSAAKRINMFLRWMVRKDKNRVDFGLWNTISQKELMCPLDVHSGTIARHLKLLTRKQNDWAAVEELTNNLRSFDSDDPVKYDYALFGLGVFKQFGHLD